MAVFSCACCGSDVTAPYFHNGHVYGYTCIKKVDPSIKKVKDAGLWISADSVEVSQVEGLQKIRLVAKVGKFSFAEEVYGTMETHRTSIIMAGAKMVKIAQCQNGSDGIWKNFEIVQRWEGGSRLPVEFKHWKTQKVLIKF